MAKIWVIMVCAILVFSGIFAVISIDNADTSDDYEKEQFQNNKEIDNKINTEDNRNDREKQESEENCKDKERKEREKKETWEKEHKEREKKEESNKNLDNKEKDKNPEEIKEHEKIIKKLKEEETELEKKIDMIFIEIENRENKINEIKRDIEDLKMHLKEAEDERKIEIKEKIERLNNKIFELIREIDEFNKRIEPIKEEIEKIRHEIEEHFDIIEKLKNNKYEEKNGFDLKIRWGYLDERMHENNELICWNGGIFIARGNLKLIKPLLFEKSKNYDGDLIYPQIFPNLLLWKSSTTVHWDGVLVHLNQINHPPIKYHEKEKNDDCKKREWKEEEWNDDGERERKEKEHNFKEELQIFVIIYTPHWKGIFTPEELRNIDEVIKIDDLGHEISLKSGNKPTKEKEEKPHIFVDVEIFAKEDKIKNDVVINAFLKDLPVAHAKVLIDDEYFGETNEKGYPEISNLPPGEHYAYVTNGEFFGETKFFIVEHKYEIHLKFETFDDDGDGLNDDVIISLIDNIKKPIPEAKVTINKEFVGFTDENGKIAFFDLKRGEHFIFVHYQDFFAETEFYSEGFEEKEFHIFIEIETFDKNVAIHVINTFKEPIGGAMVYVDEEFIGSTNFEGFIEAFKFEEGEHFVEVKFWEHIAYAEFFIGEKKNKITINIETFDDDGDEFLDDVIINVISLDGEPIGGAMVYIDMELFGSTNFEGILEAFDFRTGEHFVEVIYWESSVFTEFKV